jgi:hypothetical protein
MHAISRHGGGALSTIPHADGGDEVRSVGIRVAALGTLVSLAGLLIPPALRDSHADPRPPKQAAQYLVFERTQPGRFRLVHRRTVTLRGPLVSRREDEAERARLRPPRDRERVLVRLLDAPGRTVYTDVVEVPSWLRGEFDDGGAIRGTAVGVDRPAFVVRVPLVARGRLELRDDAGGTVVDLAAAPPPAPPDTVVHAAVVSGDPENRVDQLIVGDGYTVEEENKFDADAAAVVDQFFSVSPYAEYANFVNVTTLFMPSPQSGADHPPYDAGCPGSETPTCCADRQAATDPRAGTFVETALDASFCAFNTHRLVTVNPAKLFAAAAAVPDWDTILVIVNDPTYGGSGGFASVFTVDPAAVEIARHEYGHSFTRLADEYADPNPGYPACSDLDGVPCEANVTDQTARPDLKWQHWIAPSTPVPTPDADAYETVVGLFQGARFLPDLYRPRRTCRMRVLGTPFCEICRQEYVLALYRGGWGAPAGGIDSIEPDSETPPPGTLQVFSPASVTFSIGLLEPLGGPPVRVTWRVDGAEVPGETSSSFTYTRSTPGTVRLEVQTHDDTAFVHPMMAGALLDHARTWTVVFAAPPTTTTTTTAITTTTTTSAEVSTTTSAETSTTTSTTTSPAVTTTEPAGGISTACEIATTFGSVQCRLGLLADATTDAVEPPALRTGLLRKLQLCIARTGEGSQSHSAGRSRPARASLAKAIRALVAFRTRLTTRKARRTVSSASRRALLDSAGRIEHDARELRAML